MIASNVSDEELVLNVPGSEPCNDRNEEQEEVSIASIKDQLKALQLSDYKAKIIVPFPNLKGYLNSFQSTIWGIKGVMQPRKQQSIVSFDKKTLSVHMFT